MLTDFFVSHRIVQITKTTKGEQVGHEFWSNTRKTVYFTIYKENKSEIRKINIDSGEENVIKQIYNCHSSIDPKDRFIIADNDHGNADELFLIDLISRDSYVLCKPKMSWTEPKFHPHPTFSPDSKKVIYTSDFEGKAAVYLATLPESLV